MRHGFVEMRGDFVDAGERIKSRLSAAGVDEVATHLDEAVSHLRQTS